MSAAKCNRDLYTLFLIGEPHHPQCTKLAGVMEGFSHDAVNRFLNREHYSGKDLFKENRQYFDTRNFVASIDDSVEDKAYSNPRYNDYVTYTSYRHKAAFAEYLEFQSE